MLALRILPGVDVLETRWSAAKVAFDKAGVDVVGVEFTDGDPARTKKIVNDYIQRYGTIDGRLDGRGGGRGARRSRRSRTPASPCRRSTARTSSTS